MATTIVHDAIGANTGALPPGPAAGYVTGTGPVPWTAQDWMAHPGAVRIDQDPAASDPTADVLDVETAAATPADCPAWAKRAIADYAAARRPGQRAPAIYVNRSNMTAVADALNAGGIGGGVGLWLAIPDMPQPAAEALIERASGPFPIVAVQFKWGPSYDTNVFSTAWLTAVSRIPAPAPAPPPRPAPVPGRETTMLIVHITGYPVVYLKDGTTFDHITSVANEDEFTAAGIPHVHLDAVQFAALTGAPPLPPAAP